MTALPLVLHYVHQNLSIPQQHVRLLTSVYRLQPAEFPCYCVFLQIDSCVLVCLDRE